MTVVFLGNVNPLYKDRVAFIKTGGVLPLKFLESAFVPPVLALSLLRGRHVLPRLLPLTAQGEALLVQDAARRVLTSVSFQILRSWSQLLI